MEWTKDHIAKLINLYKNQTCLYNMKDPFYKNKHARTAAFSEIQMAMEEIRPKSTIEDIKAKINSIRSHYSHELKKVRNSARSGSCADAIYQPTVWWFDMMGFLKDFVNARSTESNLHSHGEESNNSSIVFDPLGEIQNGTNISFIKQDASSEEESDIEAVEEINFTPKRRKTNDEVLGRKKKLLITASHILKNADTSKNSFPKNINHFLNYVGSELVEIKNVKILNELKKTIIMDVFEAKSKDNST